MKPIFLFSGIAMMSALSGTCVAGEVYGGVGLAQTRIGSDAHNDTAMANLGPLPTPFAVHTPSYSVRGGAGSVFAGYAFDPEWAIELGYTASSKLGHEAVGHCGFVANCVHPPRFAVDTQSKAWELLAVRSFATKTGWTVDARLGVARMRIEDQALGSPFPDDSDHLVPQSRSATVGMAGLGATVAFSPRWSGQVVLDQYAKDGPFSNRRLSARVAFRY